MNHAVIIIGTGGHARILGEVLQATGARVLGFTDAAQSEYGKTIAGLTVLGTDDVLQRYSQDEVLLVNGLGSIDVLGTRRAVYERLATAGWRFASVVHPRAMVSPTARIEGGVQIMAGAVIQTGATIGYGSIVNTAAVVDHDCVVGAHCHVAPGAVLSGGVMLGTGCHVGTGAVIIQSITLGIDTFVGAGAVVVHNHPAGSRLLGIPARAKVEK